MRIEVSECHNAPFGTGGVPIFVIFDGGKSHGREGSANNGTDTFILRLCYSDPGGKVLESIVLFVITPLPCTVIGGAEGVHLEKCRGIGFM